MVNVIYEFFTTVRLTIYGFVSMDTQTLKKGIKDEKVLSISFRYNYCH